MLKRGPGRYRGRPDVLKNPWKDTRPEDSVNGSGAVHRLHSSFVRARREFARAPPPRKCREVLRLAVDVHPELDVAAIGLRRQVSVAIRVFPDLVYRAVRSAAGLPRLGKSVESIH